MTCVAHYPKIFPGLYNLPKKHTARSVNILVLIYQDMSILAMEIIFYIFVVAEQNNRPKNKIAKIKYGLRF
ncbi:hypothetical protein DS62_12245 [Smithella sp. SC_K08D17]|nr:hypothetical protein DS62_12245 [Smithella sp. SC_K08D17]